jgi:hypothetical protein
MFFSEISLCNILSFISKALCTFIASWSTSKSWGIDLKSRIPQLADETTKQRKMRLSNEIFSWAYRLVVCFLPQDRPPCCCLTGSYPISGYWALIFGTASIQSWQTFVPWKIPNNAQTVKLAEWSMNEGVWLRLWKGRQQTKHDGLKGLPTCQSQSFAHVRNIGDAMVAQ